MAPLALLTPLALTFTNEINLGQMITLGGILAAVVSAFYVSQTRLGYIEREQANLGTSLGKLADRFTLTVEKIQTETRRDLEKHGDIVFGLAGEVQKLVGATTALAERRILPRTGSNG